MNHGFFQWVGKVDRATAANDEASAWLKSAFAQA